MRREVPAMARSGFFGAPSKTLAMTVRRRGMLGECVSGCLACAGVAGVLMLGLMAFGIYWFLFRAEPETPVASPTPMATGTPRAETPTPVSATRIPTPASPTPQPTENLGAYPDLVVTDILTAGPYLYVEYANQGAGRTGGDFLIRTSSGGKTFDGNSYSRFQVPEPGTRALTGGLSLGLVGLEPGKEAMVSVEVDWEDRVAETDKTNNTLIQTLAIPTQSEKKQVETVRPGIPVKAAQGPVQLTVDLIVTDVAVKEGKLLIAYENQGTASAEGTFRLDVSPGTGTTTQVGPLKVPAGRGRGSAEVPLSSLGLAPDEAVMVTVTIDSGSEIEESREENNLFYEQL